MRRYLQNNRGQALVEFALIIPVLMFLLLGIIEFGFVMHEYMVVAEASREGARAAALGGDDAAVAVTAKNAAPSLDNSQLRISITPSSTSRISGDPVTVTVEYPIKPVTPMFSAFLGADFTVKGVTVMRME